MKILGLCLGLILLREKLATLQFYLTSLFGEIDSINVSHWIFSVVENRLLSRCKANYE
jgi:hypothetical protein